MYKIIQPLTTNRSLVVQRESRAFTHRSRCFPCSLGFVLDQMIANPAPHILATQPGLFKRTMHKVLIYEVSSIFLGWSLTKDCSVNPVEMPECRGEVLSFSTHNFQLYSVNRSNWGRGGPQGLQSWSFSRWRHTRSKNLHLIASSLNAKKIKVIKDLLCW